MAKYFEVDLRRGSFQETMGRSFSLIGTPVLRKSDNRICLISDRNNHLSYSTQVIPNGAFTVIFYYKYNNRIVVTNEIIPIISVDGRGVYPSIDLVYNGTFLLFLGSGNYRYFPFSYDKQWHCIIVTVPGSAQTDINSSAAYQDGIALAAGTTQTSTVQSARDTVIRVGGNYDTYVGTTEIGYIAAYDHVFTETERAKAYSDFLNSYPILLEKYPQQIISNKPESLNRLKNADLIAAYNMKPIGNVLPDISGNGNDVTLYKTITVKDGIKFFNDYARIISVPNCYGFKSGTIPYSNSVPISNLISVENIIVSGDLQFLISAGFEPYSKHLLTFNNAIIACSYHGGYVAPYAHYCSYDTGNISKVKTIAYSFDGTTYRLWVNGVEITVTTISGGYVSAQTSAGLTIGALMRGGSYNQIKDATIKDIRIYKKLVTDKEVKEYHNSFVNPYFIEDFSSELADGLTKIPVGWTKTSGTFKISQSIYNKEIILNGDFNSSTGWYNSGAWTIAGGVAHFDQGGNERLFQYITTSLYEWYVIKFKIRNATGIGARIYLCNEANVALLSSRNNIFDYQNGDYSFEGFIINAGTQLRILAYYAGSAFDIDDVSFIKISKLLSINSKTKYLECLSSSSNITIPSKQAYGTWEFDLFEGASVDNYITIALISNISNFGLMSGYYFTITSGATPYIRFIEIQNGVITAYLMDSAFGYIARNTWYGFKITRTYSGVFSIYIKGGSYGNNWTLIPAVVGSNPFSDNTYTVSNYFIFRGGVSSGDRITNIKFLDGIKQ